MVNSLRSDRSARASGQSWSHCFDGEASCLLNLQTIKIFGSDNPLTNPCSGSAIKRPPADVRVRCNNNNKKTDMKLICNILMVLSLFFFVESAYEMFVLTAMRGPQMLFFSLIHVWPFWLITLFFISWFSFYGSIFCNLVFFIVRRFGKLKKHNRYAKVLFVVLTIQVIYFILAITYEKWSHILFSKGI
jgi:hypothetical protein